jgi:hypothetical protein
MGMNTSTKHLVRLNVLVEADLLDELRALAHAGDRSTSHEVRRVLRAHVARERKPKLTPMTASVARS